MRYTISLLLASATIGATTARAEVPSVVTDIPPIHSLVSMVMDGVGTPVLLLDAGADAHNFQLRPSKAAALEGADLVVWVGPEMTPWLDRSIEGLATGVDQLVLLDAPGTTTRLFSGHDGHDEAGHEEAGHEEAGHEEAGHEEAGHDLGHDHGHAETAAGGDAHDHADEDHAHDGTDPHAWLDPANAQLWLGLIAAELARIDPANAEAYALNAERAGVGIAELDAGLAARLAPVQGKPFVVFHDAYGYFADHYGLDVAGAIALGDASSPGAAHLRDLQSKIGQSGTLCVFPEAQHDVKQAEAMAADTGARLGGALDPEGAALEPGPQVYGQIMTGLADTILACLADA